MTTRPLLITCLALMTLGLTSSSATAAGGLKPSQAPLVAVGTQYFGTTDDPSSSDTQEEFWALPSLLAQDVVTVAWNDRDATWATRLCLVQGIDDFTFGSAKCDVWDGHETRQGSARSEIDVPSTSAASFLRFHKRGFTCCGDGGPYDFVVEAIRHRIGVATTRRSRIARRTKVAASANLTNGSAVPDGLVFDLTAKRGRRSRSFSATSIGGRLTFNIALPNSWRKRIVKLSVSRPEDDQYLATRSVSQRVRVK